MIELPGTQIVAAMVLGAIGVLVVLMLGLAARSRHRRSPGMSRPVAAAEADMVVLSYDGYWEQEFAVPVKAWLEKRFPRATVKAIPFDTESKGGIDHETITSAASAGEFVALVCAHYLRSTIAGTLLTTRIAKAGATRLFSIEAAVREALTAEESLDTLWTAAVRSGPVGILYDEADPDRVKQGAALDAELDRVFAALSSPPAVIHFDYFISYNKEWSAIADHIETYLRNKSPRVFRDKTRLEPGVELDSALPALAASAKDFVLIVSTEYLASELCAAELKGFFGSLKPDDGRKIIPVLVEPIRPMLEAMKSDAWKAVCRALDINLCPVSETPLTTNEIRRRIVEELGKGNLPLDLTDVFEPKFDESGIPRIPHFCGRIDDLARIAQILDMPEHPDDGPQPRRAKGQGQLRALIQAGPGFGKTTLAARFARDRRKCFLGVWWIRSETRTTILLDVQRISETPQDASDSDDAVSMTIERAAALVAARFPNPAFPYLLIFDNVKRDTFEIVQRLAGAAPPNVRILVTSRAPLRVAEDEQVLKLETLDPKDGTSLLLKLAGSSDREGAGRLAEALGYLPLALRHAGCVCKLSSSFDEYRKQLTESLRDEVRSGSEDLKVDDTIRASLAEAGKQSPAALDLMDLLTYCAAERIPISLINACFQNRPQTRSALAALENVGLIQDSGEFKIEGGAPPDKWITVHRLVQQLIRKEVDESGRSLAVVAKLMPALCNLLVVDPDEESGELRRGVANDVTFKRYFPHFLGALPHLNEPGFRGAETVAPFDEVAKLVILKLQQDVREGLDIAAESEAWRDLPALLGCFYEIDPLQLVLDYLVESLAPHREAWREFRKLCLAENNYVLRFGLAEALAGAVEKDLLPLDEVLRLVRLDRKLNEFELGGYAFKALASRRPNLARDHGEQLQVLARHKCYPGRSILGDLMLNLVYQGEMPSQLLPIETAQDFWRPCWCFVEYDVLAIRAAELDRGGGLHEPALCDDIAALGRLKEWRDQARTHLEAYPSLAFVVDNVFTIGSQTNKIKDARDEIAAIADSELILTVLRLFFGHPLWSVAESMASVLSELHRLQPGSGRYRNLIHQMFDEPDWRVRYGAVEAAFQIRQTEKNTTFFEAVDRFHDDRNKKLRGLCAENLFAIMLNQSDSERIGLERLFEAKIRVWLKDDDCWVLEHVYRYLNALHQRFGASPNQAKSGKVPFVDGPTSPLLEDLPDWWALDRETVLRHIDCAKRKARKGGGKG